MAHTDVVRTKDLVGVSSRISWGAIFAGAIVALAVQLLLTLLGGSIGLSIRDEVTSETFGTSAAIYGVASIIIALFVGGYVTSQCTVGENHGEATLHGLIMWGVTFAIVVWLTAAGVRAGFNAMVSAASVGTSALQGVDENWEALARRAGATDADIESIRNRTAATTEAAQDPANQEKAADVAMQASWWTLFGVMLSMAAAALGAFLGAGPNIRLLGTHTATAVQVRTPAAGA
jgi:hypothetical protein